MVLFLILFGIVIYMASYEKPKVHIYLVMYTCMCITFYCLWLFEFSSGNVNFFISDEGYYYNLGLEPDIYLDITNQRYLWILINHWIFNYDLALGGHAIKLINIPVFLLIILLIYRIFNRNDYVLLIPLILPALPWLSIWNFRDMLILLLGVGFIYGIRDTGKMKITLSLICITGMLFIRVFYVPPLILIAVGLFWLKKRDYKKILYIILPIMFFIIVFWNQIYIRYDSISTSMVYRHGVTEVREARGEERIGEHFTGNPVRDYIASYAIYIFGQRISTAFGVIVDGGGDYGIFHSLITFINSLLFYCILLYLLFNIKEIPSIIKNISYNQIFLLLFLFMPSVIYSYNLFGVGHIRNIRLKIPFQICMVLIAILVYSKKRKYYNKTYYQDVGVLSNEKKHSNACIQSN